MIYLPLINGKLLAHSRALSPFTVVILFGFAIFFSISLQGQSNYSDCSEAHILCGKEDFSVKSLEGAGNLVSEIGTSSCYDKPFPETNSVWLKWTLATSGTLGFTIIPLNEQDDLDFVLYRLPGGLNDCEEKEELRCMTSGRVLGDDLASDAPCRGATGLNNTAQDVSEGIGCRNDSDSFLSEVQAETGESYALFINNYRSADGFFLEFSGTCAFDKSVGGCDVSTPSGIQNFEDGGLKISQPMPNPASDEVQFALQAKVSSSGTMMLVSAQGHILHTQPVSFAVGENFLKIPVSHLHHGVYFVKMWFDDRVYLSRFYKG